MEQVRLHHILWDSESLISSKAEGWWYCVPLCMHNVTPLVFAFFTLFTGVPANYQTTGDSSEHWKREIYK